MNQLLGERGKKTSKIWKDFDEVKIGDVLKGVCKYCKSQFAYAGAELALVLCGDTLIVA
jgi:hypothetical protein